MKELGYASLKNGMQGVGSYEQFPSSEVLTIFLGGKNAPGFEIANVYVEHVYSCFTSWTQLGDIQMSWTLILTL